MKVTDDMRQAAFLLSICLAVTDKLIQTEKPRSARWNRLDSLNNQVLKVTDLYRPEAWGEAEMMKAGEVFDRLNDMILEAFADTPRGSASRARLTEYLMEGRDMAEIYVPQRFAAVKPGAADFKAVKLVGMLLLERLPKHIMFDSNMLAGEYPAALQEFKDNMQVMYGEEFVESSGLQQAVIDDIMFYLERKGMLK